MCVWTYQLYLDIYSGYSTYMSSQVSLSHISVYRFTYQGRLTITHGCLVSYMAIDNTKAAL